VDNFVDNGLKTMPQATRIKVRS